MTDINPAMTAPEIIKIVTSKWNRMTDEQRKPYEVMAQRDQVRFSIELQ